MMDIGNVLSRTEQRQRWYIKNRTGEVAVAMRCDTPEMRILPGIISDDPAEFRRKRTRAH